jgi:hypothetical protein
MPAFRKPSKVPPEAFEVGKANAEGYFAYYTGSPKLNIRKASGRTRVTRLIPARKPYPLATLLERAKESVEGRGDSPASIRSDLGNAAKAKPAVYFLLYLEPATGNYVAVSNVDNPDPAYFKKPIKAGDVIITGTPTKKAIEGKGA